MFKPVRIEDEGGVIVRMVMRPQARRAMVAAAGGERRLVEGVDLGPRVGTAKATWVPSPTRSLSPIQKKGLPSAAETQGRAARIRVCSGRHLP